MKHRILILSHMFPNKVNPTSGIFVFNKVKALIQAGHEVRVVVPVPSFPFYKKWQGYRTLPSKTEIDGIPVYYVPTRMLPGGFLFYKYGKFYVRALRPVLDKIKHTFAYDIIHCHTIYPDGYAGGVLKQELGVPVVSTVHGSDISLYPQRNRHLYKKTVQALKSNDLIITVSKQLQVGVDNLVGDLNVHTIYNGFNPDIFFPIDQKEARERLGISSEKKKILFVGNLYTVKGIPYLLEAFQQLNQKNSDVELYLVGAGPLKDELQKQVVQLDIDHSVFFEGRKPYDEIPLWINSSDVVVLTSLSEGLPSILLESMGCGRPMVATDVGGIKEILQDSVTGRLARPQDAKHIAECLQDCLENDQSKKLSENAYLLSKGYTWENNIKSLESQYEKLQT